MSDTNSFTDAMLVDQPSTRRTAGAEDDDGTGIPWQINAEIDAEVAAAAQEESEEDSDDDDDDEEACVVVKVKPGKAKPKSVDDDDEYSGSEAEDVNDTDEEPAKPAKKKVASQPKSLKTAKKTAAKKSNKKKTTVPKEDAQAKSTRLSWEKTHREMVARDGTKYFQYPFLEKEGYHLDTLAANCVASTGAHLAVYGEVKAKWEEAAKLCREQVDPDGVAVFETLNHNKLQERFGKWMAFVEWHRAKLLRDSGTDDEISGNQLLDNIETMYDEKEAQEEAIAGKRDKDAKKAKVDKAGAELLKCKAAGIPIPDDVTAVLNEATDDVDNKPSGKKTKRRNSTVSDLTASSGKGSGKGSTSSKKGSPAEIVESVEELGNVARARVEVKLQAQKNKEKALNLRRYEVEMMVERKKARLEFETKAAEAKLELDRAAAKATEEAAKAVAEENRKDKEAQRKFQAQFSDFMMKLMAKENGNNGDN